MTFSNDLVARTTETNDYSDEDKQMIGGNPVLRAGRDLEDVYQGLVWNLY